MKKCKNCQHYNSKQFKFCVKCGSELQKINNIEQDTNYSLVDNSKDVNENLSFNPIKDFIRTKQITKIVLVGIIVFLISCIGLYQYGSMVYSRENQIEVYMNELSTLDSEIIADIVNVESNQFVVSPSSIEPFVKLISEDKEYFNELRVDLNNPEKGGEKDLYLRENGKIMGFYPLYELVMNPLTSTISSDFDNSSIYLNGQHIAYSTSNDFSVETKLISPGIYNFSITSELNGEIVENEISKKIIKSTAPHIIDLSLNPLSINITSNVSDVDVYLNDKKIGEITDQNTEIGPLIWEDNQYLTLKKEFDSGYLESDSVYLSNYDASYDLVFDNLANENDALFVLLNIYDTLSDYIEYSYFRYNDLSLYFHNSENNELYIEMKTFADNRNESENIYTVDFQVEITHFEQIDKFEYIVDYEVDHTSVYYTYIQQDPWHQTFSKRSKMVVERQGIFDNYQILLSEIFDEEMVYNSLIDDDV